MRNSTIVLAGAAAAALIIPAQAGAQGRLELEKGSTLWIEGTSTVHGWKCSTSTFDANFELGAKGAAIVGAGALSKADVNIPVKSLDCGHRKMNDNMYEAMRANENPTIRYALVKYELVAGTATKDSALVRATGQLTISGTTKEITMDVLARRNGRDVNGAGKVALLMTDFGIKPPVMMRGLLKTGNQITVGFELRTQLTTVVAAAWDAAVAAR